LTTSVTSTPLAASLSRYSSSFSAGTSNATWFIEPWAETSDSAPNGARGAATPGAASGASGNQKNARQSPPPMSKKKCCPSPPGSSIVFTSGIPSTFE
jgi:hypothetical protein